MKSATKQSDSNLNRTEDPEKIVQKLEEKGIKDSNFAKTVDDQVKTALDPDDFKASREWVSLEPGAGVIRDTPVLIAPDDLYAYPGRGGFLVFALDKNGDRIPDDGKDKPKTDTQKRRRKKRRAGGGMMGGMGGMMGGGMMGGQPRKKKPKTKEQLAQEAEEKAKKDQERINRGLSPAGGDAIAENDAAKDAAAGKDEEFKEVTEGHRWVVITGVLNHAQLVANYRAALKNPAYANPHYSKVAIQRQTQLPDGTWSKFEDISADENYKVLENLAEEVEESDELTPDSVRSPELVDPLAFLKSGLWERVHVAGLVPKEKKVVKKEEPAAGGYGMMGSGMMGGQTSGVGMQDQSGMMQQMMKAGSRGGQMMGGRMMGGGMMGGGMMGGG